MSGICAKTLGSVALAALVAGALVGCGKKGDPPLTTEQLSEEQKVEGAQQPGAGSNSFRRPEGNPNAKYQPTR